MRHLLIVLCIALPSLAIPAHAQIDGVIETPEGPGPDEGGGEGTFCDHCCSFYEPTQDCIRICGCGPGICEDSASSWMRSADVGWPVIKGVVTSIETARERASSTPRGRMLLSAWETHDKQVQAIFARDPGLAKRAGVALYRYWPSDMWTESGAQTHSVSREALAELRDIVTEIAKADDATGGGLAATIRSEVLPHLTPDLIGKPYPQAFQCFIGGQSCH